MDWLSFQRKADQTGSLFNPDSSQLQLLSLATLPIGGIACRANEISLNREGAIASFLLSGGSE
jgi:hypothetical protein